MIKKTVIIEIATIFILGAIPILLGYSFGGIKGFESTVSSMIPSESAMNLAIVFGAGYFLISITDWWFFKSHRITKIIWWYLRQIGIQIGGGVHSILRIGTGVFFAVVSLWAWKEPDTLTAGNVGFFLFYGFIMLAESIALAFATSALNKLPGSKP